MKQREVSWPWTVFAITVMILFIALFFAGMLAGDVPSPYR